MKMRYDMLLVGLTFAITIIAFIISIFVFVRFNKARGLWQVGMLFVMEFVYSLGYALELASTGIEGKVLFNHVQYLAVPFIGIAWVYVSKKFMNPEYEGKFHNYILLLVIPVFVFIAVQMSYYTDFDIYYRSVFLETIPFIGNTTIEVLALEKGPLYYINATYQTALTAYVVYVYLKTYRKTSGIQHRQSFFLLIAAAIGTVAIMLTFFSSVTMGVDISLYMLTAISYLIIYTMFKHEIFDLQPAAYKSTFETTTNPLLILDDKYEVVAWNSAMANLNIKPAPRYHMKLDDLFENEELVDAIKNRSVYSFKDDAKYFVMECREMMGKTHHVSGYLVEFNEITAYMNRIEKLDYQATHDELTGIYNRRAFFNKVQEFLSSNPGGGFACAMIDLDDFKGVNDTYGHVIGDHVLAEMTKLISLELDGDTFFGRYGGEEFTILFQKTEKVEVESILEHVRQIVKDHLFVYENIKINIEISIGVYYHDTDQPIGVTDMINAADTAMYASKQKGKNCVTLSSERDCMTP